MPLWRVPSTSPKPRRRKSSSAMRNPSSLSRMIDRRARAAFAQRSVVEQDAGCLTGVAADTPAKLMKLGEAEAFGVLDDDEGGIGHVDPDLDDGGRDQDPHRPGRESAHHRVLVLALHAAMHQPDRVAEDLAQVLGRAVRRRRDRPALDSSTSGQTQNTLAPSSSRRRTAAMTSLSRSSRITRVSIGRRPGGFSRQRGDVHVAVGGQDQRPRDRCRRHDQDVRRRALVGQLEALMDAEAVLLVDHRQGQVLEDDRSAGTAHGCR